MSAAAESPQAILPDAVGIHPLRFLDVNCTVGPYHNPAPGYDWSFTPLQTMLQVVYADVDDAAKRAIAGDTVRDLLREAHP
jgi:hypothetical protein